jgi:hypothetical protein
MIPTCRRALQNLDENGRLPRWNVALSKANQNK